MAREGTFIEARPSDLKGTKVNLLVEQHTSARRIYTAPVPSWFSFTRTSELIWRIQSPVNCDWFPYVSFRK